MQRRRIGLNAGYSSLYAPASRYSTTRGGRSTSTGKRPIASTFTRCDAGRTRRVTAVGAPEPGASIQSGNLSVIEAARDPGINPGINLGNVGGTAGRSPSENCAAHAPWFPGSLGSSPINRAKAEAHRRTQCATVGRAELQCSKSVRRHATTRLVSRTGGGNSSSAIRR